jgi:RNA polymerase sigma-70 factor (ECF subfamily)
MTTAPDLPLSALPAVPAQGDERPPLLLVPAPAPRSAPSSAGEEIVDFEDALRSAGPRLIRYATRRLQDPHEAEEVVQEALLRAFQHRGALATEDDLMAWLTVVTGRLVIDRLRVRGRTTPVAELPAGSRTGRDTADVVVARDEARIALDALEAMPSRQASVLWAREVEGLSYDEISERYGLSEPTVRSLLHRARRTLRREYAARGGTLPSLGLVALAPWLRGLHWANRLRSVARKGAVGTATAATGLAIATVAPLWSHPTPAHANALPAQHDSANARTAPVRTTHVLAARHVAAAPAVHVAAPKVAAPRESHTQIKVLPTGCTRTGVGVGCSAPKDSTLFVQLPNHKDVGVSNGYLPIECGSVPATPVTHCEPSDRKN